MIRGSLTAILFLLLCHSPAAGQAILLFSNGQRLTNFQSVVPFLTIAPDARAGGLGDAGVATSPDIFSQHWNPSKYVFLESKSGYAISYTPWLRKLIPNINLFYISGFYRPDQKQSISASFRYFSLGEMIFTNIYGINHWFPYVDEFAVDVAYSRLLTDNLSGAVAFRLIRSDLAGGNYFSGSQSKPGTAFAGDLALYYRKDIILSGLDSEASFGLHLSNLGNKIAYSGHQDKAFIPANLGLGGSYQVKFDIENSLSLNLDLNKLLVPTPPEYMTDSIGRYVYDKNGDRIIAAGKDLSVSALRGMIQSFYDAPGLFNENGKRSILREELNEITCSVGAEYCWRYLAFRTGYFHEHETKGNRKFFTFGTGLEIKRFQLGLSYLLPVKRNSPLSNTFRFSLGVKIG